MKCLRKLPKLPASAREGVSHVATILEHYRFNLSPMGDIAWSVGAQVLFITPAANLRDVSPFKNEHRAGLSAEALKRWQAAFAEAGRAYAAGQFDRALAAADAAMALDDRYAHLHFLRGHALEQRDRIAEAKAAYECARDEDVCHLELALKYGDPKDAARNRANVERVRRKLASKPPPAGAPGN